MKEYTSSHISHYITEMFSWRFTLLFSASLIGLLSPFWLVGWCLLFLLTPSKLQPSSHVLTLPPPPTWTLPPEALCSLLYSFSFLLFAVWLLVSVMPRRPLRALDASELDTELDIQFESSSHPAKRQHVAVAISSTAVSVDRSDLTSSVLYSCCCCMQLVKLFLYSVRQFKTCSSCREKVCLLLYI